MKLLLLQVPTKNSCVSVPPLRSQHVNPRWFYMHWQPWFIYLFFFLTTLFSPPNPACLQTSQGVKDFSVPVGLDDKVKVDLVVVGSVAVSEKGNYQSALSS